MTQRRTKRWIEARFQRRERFARLRGPATHWRLASMSFGDGRRWQIQETDDNHGGCHRTFPSAHWHTAEFDDYLTGMIDAVELCSERMATYATSITGSR